MRMDQTLRRAARRVGSRTGAVAHIHIGAGRLGGPHCHAQRQADDPARGDQLLRALVGSRLRQGDAFISDANSEALVRFDDGARLALRAESRLEINALKLKGAPAYRQKTIKILKGGLRYISGRATARNNVSFVTNTATIGIRGTDIEIAISEDAINTDPAGTYLKVNTGIATLAAVDGTQVDVDAGQIAFGGLPELVPRGAGGVRRPSARRIVESVGGLFKTG